MRKEYLGRGLESWFKAGRRSFSMIYRKGGGTNKEGQVYIIVDN